MIGVKLSSVFVVVAGAVAGTIVGGYSPEYYISVKKLPQYKYPITTQRPITRTLHYVYHGPNSNRYKNYWFNI